ncbi:transposase [Streptomyces tendae]|uniref:transposase n=1 Tax=Streptomyces tendae TaxID=1932 RepID=UPI00343C2FA8
MINAIAFKFQTGTQWVHLPGKYGNWRGVYNRLRMWAVDDTWERVFTALVAQADADGDLNWAVSVDSTIVRAHQHAAVASVPPEWLEMVLRWRKLSTNESSTVRTKFPLLLVAGRWAAERHPEATSPQAWTRDIAAEYIADTVNAVRGQWAGHNRNRTGWGEPLSASGKAGRVDSIRSFFCDLIEWEWITPRFDPRRVLALPLSVRAGRDPDPRIIDDAAWAKLMAAGLTLASDDLSAYGTPRAKVAGWHANYYPIEMIRALVGVWLFGGLRMDEIRRLELECVR